MTESLVYAVCAAAIMSFACDMLVVEGKLKKYCVAAIAIVTLALIASPLLGMVDGRAKAEDAAFTMPQVNYQSIDITKYEELMKEVYMRNIGNKN